MSLDYVVVANVIAVIGIVFCFYSFCDMGVSHDLKRGYRYYLIGTSILMLSAIILKSHPSFFLNLIWFFISLFGYLGRPVYLPLYLEKPSKLLLPFICATGFVAVVFDLKYLGAYMTSLLYVFSYLLFTAKLISKVSYYAWCMVGVVFVAPLLLHLHQYSVLGYELLGLFPSGWVVYRHIVNSRNVEVGV